MITMWNTDNGTPRVLAVFAHPDDVELSCFGTLAGLRRAGYAIHILVMTRGESLSSAVTADERVIRSLNAAAIIDAECTVANSPDGMMQVTPDVVYALQRKIETLCPQIVITLSPCKPGTDHQDHAAVAAAVARAATRADTHCCVLHAEPAVPSTGFTPNMFVDITNDYSAKLDAVRYHHEALQRPYTSEQALDLRGRWWAFHVDCDNISAARYYEAFHMSRCTTCLTELMDEQRDHSMPAIKPAELAGQLR